MFMLIYNSLTLDHIITIMKKEHGNRQNYKKKHFQRKIKSTVFFLALVKYCLTV